MVQRIPHSGAVCRSRRGPRRPLVSIRPLLSDIPLILVVPDRKESTTVAYTLGPRYIDFSYDSGEEIEIVFHHMLDNALKKELGEKWSER